MNALYGDTMRLYPGSPDAPVCSLYQSDGNPNLDVYARPGVGLPFVANRMAILFRVAAASKPSRPSTEVTLV